MYKSVISDFKELQNQEKAKQLMRFFKTWKWEYWEWDEFLGIVVPEQRKIAKKYKDISIVDVLKLLHSQYHECRLTALFILRFQYEKWWEVEKEAIVDLYMNNTKYINNWDLVDSSAHYILWDYFLNREKDVLYEFAKSDDLWKKRIAIITTAGFINNDQFTDTINISEILLNDSHDLIHKAVWWMLREVGNSDRKTEEQFLDKYATKMPRTMLRYAIEKFDEEKRQYYLHLK